MDIAVMQNGICIDAAIFEDLETARGFWGAGVWPEADAIEILPDGYGVGDSFVNGEWIRHEDPNPPEPSEPPAPAEADYLDVLKALLGV